MLSWSIGRKRKSLEIVLGNSELVTFLYWDQCSPLSLAQAINCPLLATLGKMLPTRHKGDFHPLKGSIIGALMPQRTSKWREKPRPFRCLELVLCDIRELQFLIKDVEKADWDPGSASVPQSLNTGPQHEVHDHVCLVSGFLYNYTTSHHCQAYSDDVYKW